MWWNLLIFVIGSFISAALAPRPPAPKPAAITDVDTPTAEEGRPIPVVFGTVLIRGSNVVWYGHLRADPIYSSGRGKK